MLTRSWARRAAAIAVIALFAPIPLYNNYIVDNTWYWAITWDHGFVRRGLDGELLQLFHPDDRVAAAVLCTALTALVAGLTFMVVGLLVMGRGDPASVGLGLALLASPVTVQMMWSDPRPEILAYPALALVALAMTKASARRDLVMALSGLLVGIVVLMSENVLLGLVPWMVVVVVALADDHHPAYLARVLAPLLALPAVAGAVIIAAGRADPQQVSALTASAQWLPFHGANFMFFTGQSLGDSVRYVAHADLAFLGRSLLLTGLAVGIAAGAITLMGGFAPLRLWTWDRVLVIACLLPVVAWLLQMVSGIDWPRWLGQQAGGALLTLGLVTLLGPRRTASAWTGRQVLGIVVGVVVLALIPPVPELLIQHHELSYWLKRLP